MKIDPSGDVLQGARQLASPNFDERPGDCEINLVVIHGISMPPGEYGGPWIDQLFSNCLDPDDKPCFSKVAHLKVSSHLLIRRDGELAQYVPLSKRAWHAGESAYKGRPACNDFSIGIELEGQDTEAYTEAQYDCLAEVVHTLIAAFPGLSADRIVGHSDISPQRKTDPGEAFDWRQLHTRLAAFSA